MNTVKEHVAELVSVISPYATNLLVRRFPTSIPENSERIEVSAIIKTSVKKSSRNYKLHCLAHSSWIHTGWTVFETKPGYSLDDTLTLWVYPTEFECICCARKFPGFKWWNLRMTPQEIQQKLKSK